jgi:uncharacterized damage-inducible protein DinB
MASAFAIEFKREIAERIGESRVRPVQAFQASGISIFVHVTEHLSYHTGQIAFWTKQLKDKGLGFYAGMDLNRRAGTPEAPGPVTAR